MASLVFRRDGKEPAVNSYKDLLARTGRDGKWMEFLREQEIPRTTADRYIAAEASG